MFFIVQIVIRLSSRQRCQAPWMPLRVAPFSKSDWNTWKRFLFVLIMQLIRYTMLHFHPCLPVFPYLKKLTLDCPTAFDALVLLEKWTDDHLVFLDFKQSFLSTSSWVFHDSVKLSKVEPSSRFRTVWHNHDSFEVHIKFWSARVITLLTLRLNT